MVDNTEKKPLIEKETKQMQSNAPKAFISVSVIIAMVIVCFSAI